MTDRHQTPDTLPTEPCLQSSFFVFPLFLFFQTGSHYIGQAGLSSPVEVLGSYVCTAMLAFWVPCSCPRCWLEGRKVFLREERSGSRKGSWQRATTSMRGTVTSLIKTQYRCILGVFCTEHPLPRRCILAWPQQATGTVFFRASTLSLPC